MTQDIDRTIIVLASGTDPLKLNPEHRRVISEAYQREVERLAPKLEIVIENSTERATAARYKGGQ